MRTRCSSRHAYSGHQVFGIDYGSESSCKASLLTGESSWLQEKEGYVTELEELISQCEALMTDKAGLEEQLLSRGSVDGELNARLERLEAENARLCNDLEAARDEAKQACICPVRRRSQILQAFSRT